MTQLTTSSRRHHFVASFVEQITTPSNPHPPALRSLNLKRSASSAFGAMDGNEKSISSISVIE